MTDNSDSNRRVLLIFLVIWGIVNLLQAAFTPLHNDEAYYWMYSRYPAWGYYDHPPMIAMLILAGSILIKGELGVRLLVVASQLVTLRLAWELTDEDARKRKGSVSVFITLVLLMPLLHVYGFIAVPDSPLLLFTAFYLFILKRFSDRATLLNMILLCLSMAGLVYSKYHGVLVIVFSILAFPQLLNRPHFYAAAILSIILFLPHVAWQVSNGFPSMQYHLVDRVEGIDISNVPEYLLNQMAVHNPLLLVLLALVFFRSRAGSRPERTFRFITAGFLVFFFISSFRYHVEPHWTAAISVPVLVLLFNSAGKAWKPDKIISPAVILFLPLLILARLALVFDIIPARYLKREFHGTEERMSQIRKVAGERPVVFTNSYQDPARYTFHTGAFAHTLNNLAYRRSQYDIWNFEEELHGREVLYVPHWLTPEYKKNLVKYHLSSGDSLFARVIPDFQSLQKRCINLLAVNNQAVAGSAVSIDIALYNPYPYNIKIDHPLLPVRFQAAFFKSGRLVSKQNLLLPEDLSFPAPGDTIRFSVQFTVPALEPGEYMFGITSETGFLLDVISSDVTNVHVPGLTIPGLTIPGLKSGVTSTSVTSSRSGTAGL